MGVRLAGNQNAAIFDDFWQSRTPTYWTYFKREFDKKGVNIGVLAGFVLLLAGMASESSVMAHIKTISPVVPAKAIVSSDKYIIPTIAHIKVIKPADMLPAII